MTELGENVIRRTFAQWIKLTIYLHSASISVCKQWIYINSFLIYYETNGLIKTKKKKDSSKCRLYCDYIAARFKMSWNQCVFYLFLHITVKAANKRNYKYVTYFVQWRILTSKLHLPPKGRSFSYIDTSLTNTNYSISVFICTIIQVWWGLRLNFIWYNIFKNYYRKYTTFPLTII